MVGIENVNPDKIVTQTHHDVTWLDVQKPDSQTFGQLEKQYGLHPLHLTESVQKVQHTQVEREDEYIFLVLHFPIFETHTDKIRVGQVGVFLGRDYVITVHNHQSPTIQDMLLNSDRSPEQAQANFGQGSAYLLYRIISKLLENISGMAELVESELDRIEGIVFDNSRSDAERIGKIRQKIIRLRRLIGPKRMVLQDLAEQINSFSGTDMTKYYANNVKMVNKLWEGIEEARETIEVYKDADFTTSTEHTNRILAILTLIFTFTIPVTVIGTLYGMNVLLPGGIETNPWTFWGRYTTFILIFIISSAVAAGMYIYFRKKKWF
jgi:magnesium transporter